MGFFGQKKRGEREDRKAKEKEDKKGWLLERREEKEERKSRIGQGEIGRKISKGGVVDFCLLFGFV